MILPALAGLFLTTTLSAQSVSGVVNDENGQPLPGATVLANGGARGVSTDMDGRYTLPLGAGNHSIDYSF
ncbi:MAG: carboxypeptidase regulatory-like domain-containing protein, partial [Flavobacteriales bacterium]